MALSAARNTPARVVPWATTEEYGMAASTTIYAGGLVMLDAGFAKPGATAVGKFAVGRALETKTNSGAAGAKTIKVDTGIFKDTNSGADAVDADDVGAACFIVDDETVAETNGTNTRSAAGIVYGVDSDGVWVKVNNGQRLT
jgi:hypothetical protein